MFYQTHQVQGSVRSIEHHYGHGIAEPMHQHQAIQLLHVIQGVIRVYTPDGCWVVPPTQGIWIPEGSAHSLLAVGAVSIDTVFIEPHLGRDRAHKLGTFQVNALLSALIHTATTFEATVQEDSREARVNALILDEVARLNFRDFNVPMPKEPVLKQACLHISEHVARPWALADMALMLSVSERTVSRKFYAHMGMSFGEWLRQLRLAKSMELMASGYSVTDAALAVGYESHSSFSMMFKQRVGIAPSLFVAH